MNGKEVTKILLGWPWYNGPDVDSFPTYMNLIHYFGMLQERSLWLHTEGNSIETLQEKDRKLDTSEEGDEGELRESDGVFEFGYQDLCGTSLVGWAREKIVQAGLDNGYDYLFMFDDDMQFPAKTLLRFLRYNKPIVNALAFTSSVRPEPCLYKVDIKDKDGIPLYETDIVYDYPKDKLITDEDIGGVIAHGAGVTLYNLNVFRKIERPWFATTGCGEDWFFCLRAHHYGVKRYVDTGIVVNHKDRTVKWNNCFTYDEAREKYPEWYKKRIEYGVSSRHGGIV